MTAAETKNKKALSENELAQRIAIVKRFRELLIRQRDRFRTYLTVLDKQNAIIDSGSADDLLAYVELEEHIVADIFSIQKVIDPLELMYRTKNDDGIDSDFNVNDVEAIKTTLENLKNQAEGQSRNNRELISARMNGIRAEIRALRNNPFAMSSAYKTANTASLIDIRG